MLGIATPTLDFSHRCLEGVAVDAMNRVPHGLRGDLGGTLEFVDPKELLRAANLARVHFPGMEPVRLTCSPAAR